VVRLFEIKLESLVLVVPAINIVIETTVSWRVGCIGFYHHRDLGGGAVPGLEARDSSTGTVVVVVKKKV